MKSFKQYLIESKKVYEFKVKIAGDLDKDASAQIKAALSKYQVENCSSGKRTPIQESPIDFPTKKNVNVTVFDVSVAYPTNSISIREAIADKLNLTSCCIKVCNLKEEEEYEINHQFDEISSEALLTKEYETIDSSSLTGETQKMNLLKELSKLKHEQEQYKGVNDQLLASKVPNTSDGPAAKAFKENSLSPVGSRKVTLPTAKTAKGK